MKQPRQQKSLQVYAEVQQTKPDPTNPQSLHNVSRASTPKNTNPPICRTCPGSRTPIRFDLNHRKRTHKTQARSRALQPWTAAASWPLLQPFAASGPPDREMVVKPEELQPCISARMLSQAGTCPQAFIGGKVTRKTLQCPTMRSSESGKSSSYVVIT